MTLRSVVTVFYASNYSTSMASLYRLFGCSIKDSDGELGASAHVRTLMSGKVDSDQVRFAIIQFDTLSAICHIVL